MNCNDYKTGDNNMLKHNTGLFILMMQYYQIFHHTATK